MRLTHLQFVDSGKVPSPPFAFVIPAIVRRRAFSGRFKCTIRNQNQQPDLHTLLCCVQREHCSSLAGTWRESFSIKEGRDHTYISMNNRQTSISLARGYGAHVLGPRIERKREVAGQSCNKVGIQRDPRLPRMVGKSLF